MIRHETSNWLSAFALQLTVRKHKPIGIWCHYLEIKWRSNWWLIKTREPAITKERLKMSIKVNPAVFWILESMKSSWICDITINKVNVDFILSFNETSDLEHMSIKLDVFSLAINFYRFDRIAMEI